MAGGTQEEADRRKGRCCNAQISRVHAPRLFYSQATCCHQVYLFPRGKSAFSLSFPCLFPSSMITCPETTVTCHVVFRVPFYVLSSDVSCNACPRCTRNCQEPLFCALFHRLPSIPHFFSIFNIMLIWLCGVVENSGREWVLVCASHTNFQSCNIHKHSKKNQGACGGKGLQPDATVTLELQLLI